MDRFYIYYCPLLSRVTGNNIKSMKIIIKYSSGIRIEFCNIQMFSVGCKPG